MAHSRLSSASPLRVLPYEFFIGLRYTRARQRTRFISFISVVSVVGMALGMMVLITVLSVMNGFQREIRNRILGVASHVQITGPNEVLQNWQEIEKEALKNDQVIAAAPYVNAQALLTHGSAVHGAFIRGIVPEMEERVANFQRHMRSGNLGALKAGEYNIILGYQLAGMLGVTVGDKVVVVAPQGQVTPAGVIPRLRQFTVAGLFNVDQFEFDSGLALVHIDDARTLFRFGDAVSGVRLKLKDIFQSREVARELVRSIGREIYATDWTMQNANLLRAIAIEKRMMFLIIFLIIAVAAFNIVSSLVMAVKDKQADIAILRTLGATPGSITKIFLVQGTMIGVIGTVLGVVSGVILALNVESAVQLIEYVFGFKFFSKDVYLISELPSELQIGDVVLTGVASFVLSLLATIYPSFRAAKVNPAEALRYE